MSRRFTIVGPVLVRGPLLPVRALSRARAELLAHPLGPAALALASPTLVAAAEGARGVKAAARAPKAGARKKGKGAPGEKAQVRADEAIERYARRAAFRATPAGLLAGVAVAGVGARTRLASTDDVGAVLLRPSWGRLAALGRALLDEPALRAGVRLRVCPSLVLGRGELTWLAAGAEALVVRTAAIDEELAAVVEAAREWTAWPELVAGLGGDEGDVDLDDFLLTLVDAGLLCHDLEPPLVGPPAARWWGERQARLRGAVSDEGHPALDGVAAALKTVEDAALRFDVAAARAALAQVPGHRTAADGAGERGLHGGLGLVLGKGATVARAALERAAELAPLLFGLQEALAAPVAERALDEALLGRLDEAAEVYGAGALSLAALIDGGYGARLAELEEPVRVPEAPAPALLSLLVTTITAAAREGEAEVALDPVALAACVPEVASPPTFELFLAPAREPARARPGTGWLLGLHAPAGASFGRFAELAGAAIAPALAGIAAAEAAARPGEVALDVVHAAGPALAELSAHPPVRAAALALTGWPAGAAVTPAELDLVVDGAAAEPSALRHPRLGPVAPAPLHRVRSSTVPAGLYRLLAGWSFARQHAPWAMTWGALADLPWLPRVTLEGFVIAPASWALPPRQVLGDARGFARWRADAPKLPRLVQVGVGDELLPVDLEATGAAEELVRHGGGRVFEVWPPLNRLADEGGRRLEVIAAVAATPEPGVAAAIAATARAGAVPPPAEAPPPAEWLTFRVYGPREHEDAILASAVRALVLGARAAGELSGWFFVRYLDPGTGRAHLRVRLCAHSASARAALGRRAEEAFAGAVAAGLATAIETAGYFRETARYGSAEALAVAEQLFELGSDLVIDLLAAGQGEAEGAETDLGDEPRDEAELLIEADPRTLGVRAVDALVRGFGQPLAQRRALAERRRAAFAAVVGDEPEELAGEYRAVGRALADALAADARVAAADPTWADLGPGAIFAAHARAVATRLGACPPEVTSALTAALPALLHMQIGRLQGPNADAERDVHVFWARALESLVARGR